MLNIWIPNERYEAVMKEKEQTQSLLQVALAENKWLNNRLATYAQHIHQLVEGDTHHMNQMYADLRADGFADEDGFPLYPEDLYPEEYRSPDDPRYKKKEAIE